VSNSITVILRLIPSSDRSFYSSDRFADIPFPPSEDWEAATGKVCHRLAVVEAAV
jgi:hypothetical protein